MDSNHNDAMTHIRPSLTVQIANGDPMLIEIEPDRSIVGTIYSKASNTYVELCICEIENDDRPGVSISESGMHFGRSCACLPPAGIAVVCAFLADQRFRYVDCHKQARDGRAVTEEQMGA